MEDYDRSRYAIITATPKPSIGTDSKIFLPTYSNIEDKNKLLFPYKSLAIKREGEVIFN